MAAWGVPTRPSCFCQRLFLPTAFPFPCRGFPEWSAQMLYANDERDQDRDHDHERDLIAAVAEALGDCGEV